MTETVARADDDLAAAVFIALRRSLFDASGKPLLFTLKDKGKTQDDPFDVYLSELLSRELKSASCLKSPGAPRPSKRKKNKGSNTSPDMVVIRPDLCIGVSAKEILNLRSVVALEVKKLHRTAGGKVARGSGADFNTTPPCGTIVVYDHAGGPVHVRAFYLFFCLEQDDGGQQFASAMLMVDGNVLNANFELYINIVNPRKKAIGLGTYGDGINRQRPMFVFPNPLACKSFDHQRTLLHPSSDLATENLELRRIAKVTRAVPDKETATFYAYRTKEDVTGNGIEPDICDPFAKPKSREVTSHRGRFFLPLRLTR